NSRPSTPTNRGVTFFVGNKPSPGMIRRGEKNPLPSAIMATFELGAYKTQKQTSEDRYKQRVMEVNFLLSHDMRSPHPRSTSMHPDAPSRTNHFYSLDLLLSGDLDRTDFIQAIKPISSFLIKVRK
ncbi:hypothetical protein DID80_05865, partial [Candidatus Marinamargulisbacteria bacterium SCGC AAA071-K20]